VENPDSIRSFWFGFDPDDAVTAQQRSKLWWSKNPEIDQEIRQRFAPYVEAVACHELDAWANRAGGLLALILLIDQFPRSMYRNSPKAFEYDTLAQQWSLNGIEHGLDKKLRPIERVFFYLPFEHSEDAAHQDLSVKLFTRLYQEVPPEHMDIFRGFLTFALRHRRIIERFGRFPHRNNALGRMSTSEEIDFLQTPGSSF